MANDGPWKGLLASYIDGSAYQPQSPTAAQAAAAPTTPQNPVYQGILATGAPSAVGLRSSRSHYKAES